MTVRWSILAGILATLLFGAALVGGEGGARPGSSRGPGAAPARSRLRERVERERTELLRRQAAAREEEEARWSAETAASADEIRIDDGTPEDLSRGNRGDESGAGLPDIACTEGALVITSPPDDRGEPEIVEAPPPPPSPEAWLARHQGEDGSWDGATLSGRCTDGGCAGAGEPGRSVGDTGLALLAFLGNGETHKTPRHGLTVRNGLKHLKSIQDVEGCYGARTAEGWLEDHALATLAMAEAYGLTQSPLFKATAQNSVAFLESCRDPYLAWRYGAVPGPRDAATTAWAAMALKSAKGAGLEVAPEGFEGAMRWFEDRTDPVTGRVWPVEEGEDGERTADAHTAMGMLVRIFGGVERDDPRVNAGARSLVEGIQEIPEPARERNPLLDGFGTLAMFQVGGAGYQRWRDTVVASLLDGFLGDERGCAAGSSDPPGSGPGVCLGRLRTTALDAMTRAVIYRYRCRFGPAEED